MTLSGLQLAFAQSKPDLSYNNWMVGITAGVLTAYGPKLVRRYLPPIIGIIAKKQLSAGSNIIAEAHYSLWGETQTFTDWYSYYRPLFSYFREPFDYVEPPEYPRPPKEIKMESIRLNVGYETSAVSFLRLPIFVGGKLGLRFYEERWQYWQRMDYFKYRPPAIPGPGEILIYPPERPSLEPIRYTKRSETQITVSLFGGLRFGRPNRGQCIYVEYSIPHELLEWIGGDAPSQSTDGGFRILAVYPILHLTGDRERRNDTGRTMDIGGVNLMVGKAGFGSGIRTQPGKSMYGFQLSWIIKPRVFLDAEVSTIYWRDFQPRDYHTSSDLELGLWWDRLVIDGRIWEFSIGPTLSVLRGSGPQASIGVFAGIRRQREFWDYDTTGWNVSLPWDTPPASPGIQVDGLLGLKLVLALSQRPTAVRAQIGFADKRWEITPDERRNLIDTSGYRFALLIPLGSF
jgi:hypothetical protein